jgi:hypothetical protein
LFDGLSAGLLFCFWWCFGAAEKSETAVKKTVDGLVWGV